jgi:hypothetical protein
MVSPGSDRAASYFQARRLAGKILHCKRKCGCGWDGLRLSIIFARLSAEVDGSDSGHHPRRRPVLDTGFGYSSLCIRKPVIPKVAPIRIVSLDQRKLPFAFPFLDQFFTGDGWYNFIMPLHINEPRLVKVQDVTRALSFAVLLDTPQYISGDPDIRTTAIPVSHDINPATFFHADLSHKHRQKKKPNPVSSTGRRGWNGEIPSRFRSFGKPRYRPKTCRSFTRRNKPQWPAILA